MVHAKLTSRRKVIQGAAAAGVALTALPGRSIAAIKLQPVKMITDWLFQGPNCGFLVGKDKGFFEQEGIDLEIIPGKGSGSTAQLIGSKIASFGFADGYVVANSIAKGIEIEMVAGIFRRNPAAVIVLDESPIKQPKDLEGKTIGIPTGSAQFQQWPAFLKGCGVDGSNIRIVNVDANSASPAVITGRVDGIAGFAQGWVPSIEIRGNKHARMLWYADCGVTAVSNGIIVRRDLIKESPDLIRAFVRASLLGFLYARAHPDEAAGIVKKNLESSDVAITRRELELSWKSWVSPATAGKPLGWMSLDDWKATTEVLRNYGGVTSPPDAATLFTNEFVPTGSEFVPSPT